MERRQQRRRRKHCASSSSTAYTPTGGPRTSTLQSGKEKQRKALEISRYASLGPSLPGRDPRYLPTDEDDDGERHKNQNRWKHNKNVSKTNLSVRLRFVGYIYVLWRARYTADLKFCLLSKLCWIIFGHVGHGRLHPELLLEAFHSKYVQVFITSAAQKRFSFAG